MLTKLAWLHHNKIPMICVAAPTDFVRASGIMTALLCIVMQSMMNRVFWFGERQKHASYFRNL